MINDRTDEDNKKSNKRGSGRGGKRRGEYRVIYCKGCLQRIEPDKSELPHRHNIRVLHKGNKDCYTKLRKRAADNIKEEPMKSNPHWGFA